MCFYPVGPGGFTCPAFVEVCFGSLNGPGGLAQELLRVGVFGDHGADVGGGETCFGYVEAPGVVVQWVLGLVRSHEVVQGAVGVAGVGGGAEGWDVGAEGGADVDGGGNS